MTQDEDDMVEDMAELLRTLGLGAHARPVSPHRVMVEEIAPAVGRLVSLARALKYTPDLKGAEAERAITALRERAVWALSPSGFQAEAAIRATKLPRDPEMF